MKIIIKDNQKTIEINKSRFIGIVKKITSKEEALLYLNNLKDEYKTATHLCYAYILPNTKKYSDNGEPTGTAGLPILEVLEKNNLNYLLAVVVRYFGGIKLGANGLIRAYTNAISNVIDNNIKELEKGYRIKIIEDYHKSEKIDYILKDSLIINKDYHDKIIIEAIIKKEILDNLSNINYEIIDEVII